MSEQAYAGLLERLVELQAILASDEQSNRYWARQELAAMLPRINEAISSLLNVLEDSRARFVGFASLIKAVTGHDSIMAEEAIERIDAALNSDAPLSIGEGRP